MSIPTISITDKGIVAPTTDEVISSLWSMFSDAFGSDLNTAMNSPQGQLVTSLAAIITDERNQMITLLNQFDPRYSQGIWQEGIGYIYFMSRKMGTHSTAQLTLIGLSGTIVPKGFQFSDDSDYLWQLLTNAQIGVSGQIKVDVQCLSAGPVEASSETITGIPTALTGLDRVFNEYAAIPGIEEESRNDFEERRKLSVALNSKNTDSATYGAVSNLSDVVDVFVRSNPTDETITIGTTDYPLIRNSILVSVVGGNPAEIAKTILSKAGSGCSFNGNTEIIVTDSENYSSRPPEYTVKFLRPEYVPIYFQVELEDKTLMSYQDESAIKNAILNGLKTGSTKSRICQAVIASRFICPVSRAVPDLGIVSLRVSKTGSDYQDKIDIGVDEFPTTTEYLISIL